MRLDAENTDAFVLMRRSSQEPGNVMFRVDALVFRPRKFPLLPLCAGFQILGFPIPYVLLLRFFFSPWKFPPSFPRSWGVKLTHLHGISE